MISESKISSIAGLLYWLSG